MMAKDGSYRWILDHANIVKRDADGRLLRMSGTHNDITAQGDRTGAGRPDPVLDRYTRLVSTTGPLAEFSGKRPGANGWKQYGTLIVQSHGKFAYESLWQEMLDLLLWF